MISCTLTQAQVHADLQEVRDRMGVCPQHNVLFDQLTVREHLEIFRNFRIEGDDDTFINELMRDIDLLQHE